MRDTWTAKHESPQSPNMYICVGFIKINVTIGSLSQGKAHIDHISNLYNYKKKWYILIKSYKGEPAQLQHTM